MTHEDILRQLPDYVLGLLPPRRLTAVEHHIAHCPACQREIISERKLSRLVRSTMDSATKTEPIHLRSLMPAAPQQRRSPLISPAWQRQMAPAILILLFFLGGLLLNKMLPAGSVPSLVATAHAATATSTYTPTSTVAQSLPDNQQTRHRSSGELSEVFAAVMPIPTLDPDHPLQTPGPPPTPVAAIMRSVAQ